MAHTTLTSLFTDIADAIRAKTGSSSAIVADDFPSAITAIPSGSSDWNWMGRNPTLVSTVYSETASINSIGYSSWTPSTSQATLRASSSLSAITLSTSYNYYVVEKFAFTSAFKSGATTANLPIRYVRTIIFPVYRTASTTRAYNSGSPNNMTTTTPTAFAIIKYYSSNNDVTYNTASYGVFSASSAPTMASATSPAPKITIKVPAIDVRGHTTYFKPANAGGIDGDRSMFNITIELWRADMGTGFYQNYYNLSLDAINP